MYEAETCKPVHNIFEFGGLSALLPSANPHEYRLVFYIQQPPANKVCKHKLTFYFYLFFLINLN